MALGTGTITEPGAESLIELEVGLVIKPGVRPTMKLKVGPATEPWAGPATEPGVGLVDKEELLVTIVSIIIINVDTSGLHNLIRIYNDKK